MNPITVNTYILTTIIAVLNVLTYATGTSTDPCLGSCTGTACTFTPKVNFFASSMG